MIDAAILQRLGDTLDSRRGADAGSSYVASLFANGEDTILRKLLEEATETLLASKQGDKLNLVREVADLWFHSLVMLAALGQHPQAVLDELDRRFGLSGHAEKAARQPSA